MGSPFARAAAPLLLVAAVAFAGCAQPLGTDDVIGGTAWSGTISHGPPTGSGNGSTTTLTQTVSSTTSQPPPPPPPPPPGPTSTSSSSTASSTSSSATTTTTASSTSSVSTTSSSSSTSSSSTSSTSGSATQTSTSSSSSSTAPPPPPNQPPTAILAADPNGGAAPLFVNFTLDGSDGDNALADLNWTFDGDGDGVPEASGTGADFPVSLGMAYDQPGNWTATLRIDDGQDLGEDQATLAIT